MEVKSIGCLYFSKVGNVVWSLLLPLLLSLFTVFSLNNIHGDR
ncbi:hypothetical protein [Phormidium tenue]|nr:hypothetical protein [Phormidium tenue]